jgi:UDP-N-acetylmuramyl pentapeptide phosphotransferase/UDP-N-acetylglucosamine-1-phosphate transferase
MSWFDLAVPLGVFLLALWLCGRVLAWLEAGAVLDRPVDRSAHRVPTPRGGGLALLPTILAAWLALALLGRAPPPAIGIALLAGALALLSWRDDLRGLPVGVRLVAHCIAVGGGIFLLPPAAVFQGLLPPAFDRLACGLLWVWFINLFNFMDGIDGISGIEAAALGFGMTLAGGIAGLPDDLAALALTITAAALAFLRWNWHPAELFLGDVGSVPLGYLLGWLLLVVAARGLWAPALILPLYYLADASITLALRVLRRERFWQPHRQHFYQRALGSDGDHAAVARLVLCGDIALVLLAVLAVAYPLVALALAALTVAIMLLLMQRRAFS